MRLKHWIQAVLGSSLLAMTGTVASAQPPAMMAPGSAAVAPWNPYGGVPPQAGGPPSMYQAWPEISPYDNSFSQTLNEGGLWSQNTNHKTKQYRLNVDYLTGRGRISDAFIGNPDAQRYIDVLRPQLTTGGGGGGGGQQQQNPILSAYGGVPNQVPGTQQPSYELYGPLRLGNLSRKFDLDGTRIEWGWDNADNSSFRLGFLYLADNSFRYDARDRLPKGKGTESALLKYLMDLPEDPADPNTVLPRDLSLLDTYIEPADINRALQNNLFNLNGLPLDDGTIVTLSDGTKIGGVTAPYDLEFRVDLRSELYGGNAEWVMSPIVDWNFLKIRPSAGLRYFLLREGFHFYGRDSGLAYTGSTGGGGGGGGTQTLTPDMKIHSPPDGIDNNRDGIIDNAGVFESGQQGGGGGGGAQNQTAVFLQFHDQFRYPISSYLDNAVDSHMGGGMVGLTFDIGGDSFLLSASSKFGLLANYEQIKMKGDNIAMHTRDSNLLLPSPADATPNAFSDEQSHTHVSPVFEQSFIAEAPLFRYVPVLRRVSLLEKAEFRFGWTFMYIGSVVDPAASVEWNGNPAAGLFPTINYKRNNYTSQSYNFGLSWSF